MSDATDHDDTTKEARTMGTPAVTVYFSTG
jgi:hypothetical protein